MKNVKLKNNLFYISIIVLMIFGCKKQEQKKILIDKVKNIQKEIEKKLICDINDDNINDTISLKAIPLKDKFTFDIALIIKYSSKNEYKTKKIYEHAEALCWGLDASFSWISLRYSEEHGQDETYYIFYDKKRDNFYLKNYYFCSPNEPIKQEYKIFDAGFYTAEINAIKLCKYSYNNYIINDTLKHSDFESKECISIPYDNSKRTIGFVESLLNVKLEQIKNN